MIPVNKAVRELLSVGKKVHEVPLNGIDIRFYVRVAVDEDRVLMFSELLENRQEVPPILVTEESHTLIDGRTRYAAYELLERSTIPCLFCEEADDQILIAAAYLANADPTSSKPPERGDIHHTIELMLKAGTPKRTIKEYFEPSLGPRMFHSYLRDVEVKIKKQRMSNARSAVAEGRMTVEEAARHYRVDLKKLKEEIKGRKRKKKEQLQPIKAGMSKAARSFAGVLSQRFHRNMERFETGELSDRDMMELLRHERALVARLAKSHEERRKRLKERLKM